MLQEPQGFIFGRLLHSPPSPLCGNRDYHLVMNRATLYYPGLDPLANTRSHVVE